jgi:hypothetical protein
MKKAGQLLFVAGIIGTLLSLFMDTSVKSSYLDTEVNNLGLLSDRTNYVIVSCFTMLIGALWMVLGKDTSAEDQVPATYYNQRDEVITEQP